MLLYLCVSSLVLIAVLFVKWRYSYWSRRDVYQFEPTFPLGNVRGEAFGKASFQTFYRNRYSDLKALKQKHGGLYVFLKAVYLPVDPQIIKLILIKDFSYFSARGGYHHPNDPLTMNLFSIDGDLWRTLRTKLTPTFTSGKMKMMFDTLVAKTTGLESLVDDYINKHEALDIKEVVARFTTDIIASVGFGIESNTLEEGNSDFRKYGKKVFTPSTLRAIFTFFAPSWFFGPLGIKAVSSDVEEFFSKTVKNIISYRENSKVFRKDFMHLLLEIKNTNKKSDKEENITEEEIIAQCFIFYLAGFETSSTTMSFALLELSLNQDIQSKLRNEIVTVLEKHNGQMTYDAIMEMKYLDMVINETLRKYPPLPTISRKCTQDYTLPGTNVLIHKGTSVRIPVWGLHTDPEYYPNPDQFNPENFTAENIASRPSKTFLPFGDGPRTCIGLRFGMMQARVGLACLLKNFIFTLNEKTRMPIQIENVSFVMSVQGDLWLDAKRI